MGSDPATLGSIPSSGANSMTKQLDKTEENILDRIDAWHESNVAITLAAYLGWSDAEYKAFVERNEIPEREYDEQE